MSSSPAGAAGSAPTAPPKRRIRNYLLNPRFQLKWTGLLCGVAFVLMVGLGAVIWKTANVAASQARTAVDQSETAARQAENAMRESQTSSTILRMQQLSQAADNPELVRTIETELHTIEQDGARNLARMRNQRDQVQGQRSQIDANRRRVLMTMFIAGVLLIFLLGATGVVITHKVVGPVFKMKRLLRQVGTGKLDIRERLRKGDELEDLFDTFLAMTESLKGYQRSEMSKLEAAIEAAEAAATEPRVVELLRALKADMSIALGSPPDSTHPPPMGG